MTLKSRMKAKRHKVKLFTLMKLKVKVYVKGIEWDGTSKPVDRNKRLFAVINIIIIINFWFTFRVQNFVVSFYQCLSKPRVLQELFIPFLSCQTVLECEIYVLFENSKVCYLRNKQFEIYECFS